MSDRVQRVAAAPVRLRAHNLLCIQGFVGKGYSPGFVANMRSTIRRLRPDRTVQILAEPDTLCAACPNLSARGCALRGPETEESIVRQDREVMTLLRIRPDEILEWGAIVERIREHVAPDDLDATCGACPWLPLGVCKQGLARLRMRDPGDAPRAV